MRKTKTIKKVRLLPYDSKWKKIYKKEEKLLRSVIGEYILDIQHVGSTSIPGAKAKPIIDIAVGVKSLKIGEKCIKPLKKLGYQYKYDAGIKGRHFFAKGSVMYRTYYVHIEKINGKLWKDHILFRNYLRINKEVVKEYSELKEKLAKKYKNDRITYTIEKIPFIQRIIKKLKKKVYL